MKTKTKDKKRERKNDRKKEDYKTINVGVGRKMKKTIKVT